MAYTKQTWANLPAQTSPLSAERLNHMEDGIYNAATTADNAASAAGTATAQIGQLSSRVTNLSEQKVDKETGKGLSTNDFNNDYKSFIDNFEIDEDGYITL